MINLGNERDYMTYKPTFLSSDMTVVGSSVYSIDHNPKVIKKLYFHWILKCYPKELKHIIN